MDLCSSHNHHLVTALRRAYLEKTGESRQIRLPDACKFTVENGKCRLRLDAKSITGNMQENSAAFEGWLLALKAWNCIDNVELSWNLEGIAPGHLHYERFLYRVSWFERLFEWFTVSEECRGLVENSRVAMAAPGSLIINTAVGTPKSEPAAKSGEALLEKALAEGDWLTKRFGIRSEMLGRQFPVGLFQGQVSAKPECRIFTGGKSAIDLIGLDSEEQRLWIFELKVLDNLKIGIVSELFFYVIMMLDLLQGRFRFDDRPTKPNGERMDHRNLMASAVKEVIGCFLAPRFHPLLDGGLINDLLNSGAWPGGVKVKFQTQEIPQELLCGVGETAG